MAVLSRTNKHASEPRAWKQDHQRNLRTKACTAAESTGSASTSVVVTIAQ